VARGIIANGTGKSNFGTKSCGCDCLVATLATKESFFTSGNDAFSRLGEFINSHYIIEHTTTDYEYALW
jgi:hypothetical protein